MPSQPSFRPEPGSIPDQPGVYRFRGVDGEVIYVGKARSLRSRLTSYFTDQRRLHPRTRAMVNTATAVDWVTVATEVQALQVEYEWIKQNDPRFNVRYRDDKSYPYLAVTLNDEYPRVMVMRGAKKKGVRYFGPYAHAWALRETVDQLLRAFPVRSCSNGVFDRHRRMGRPCLLFDIGKCAGPCVGEISETDHKELAADLCRFLSGRTDDYVEGVERAMRSAATNLDFERAARLRDNVAALRRALERSAVVLPDQTDADVIALADDELEASIQVFHVRAGRVTGQRSVIVEKPVDQSASETTEQFLASFYGDCDPADGRTLPREILISAGLPQGSAMGDYLSELRGAAVRVAVPRRGAKRDLLATVLENARQALAIHKTRRANDLSARSAALNELQTFLELPVPPLRIEAIDISGQAGQDQTAAIVVFDDGLPKRSAYRTYRVPDGLDDLASMYEVVRRRFGRSLQPVEKDRYETSLLVVDGAAGQVAAAANALADCGRHDVWVVGLAKRLEEVWRPGDDDPLILPRRSESLYLLQRLRDEAHRSAIRFHRKRRGQRASRSALDDLPGIGQVKRRALLKEFGSVRRLRAASESEIAKVPGIGPKLASVVVRELQKTSQNSGINVTTGEIVED